MLNVLHDHYSQYNYWYFCYHQLYFNDDSENYADDFHLNSNNSDDNL